MRNAIGQVRHRWLVFVATIMLPGVLIEGTEYALTGGLSGSKALIASAIGGILSVIVLLIMMKLWPKDDGKVPSPEVLSVPTGPLVEINVSSYQAPPTPAPTAVEDSVPSHQASPAPTPTAIEDSVSSYQAPPAPTPTAVEDGAPSHQASPAPTTPAAKERVFSPRTPAELLEAIEGLTDLAAETVSRPHIGSWLRLEGKIRNMSLLRLSKEQINVSLVLPLDEVDVFLLFRADIWKERLELYVEGDQISAIGKILSVSRSGYVQLEECELI